MEDAGEAVRLCEALLEEPDLDPAVRIGDAYGFLVEHHCQQGNFQVVTIFNRLNQSKVWLSILVSFWRLNSLSSSVFFLQAYRKLEELQKLLPTQNVRYYISQTSLEALQKETGVQMDHGNPRHSVKEDDEVEEDLNMS